MKFNPLLLCGLDYSGAASPIGIGTPIGGAHAYYMLSTDAAGALDEIGPLTDNQIVLGKTGAKAEIKTITGTANQVSITNGVGTLTFSLPQDIHSAATPTFAGLTCPSLDYAGALSVGGTNATVINIGRSGQTVNIIGTTHYENVDQLQVKDPLITLNKGGAVGSGADSGVEVEEDSAITAYVKVSGDRNSWVLKAPNKAFSVKLVGNDTADITIDQSSHNPVTLGTANGLSLATQQLSLALSSAGVTGALSGTDWSTFNNKQDALTFGNLTGTTNRLSATGGTNAVIGAGVSLDIDATLLPSPLAGDAAKILRATGANAASWTDLTVGIVKGSAAYRVPYQNATNTALEDNAKFTYTPGTGLKIDDDTDAANSTSGALVVTGGVGIAKHLVTGAQIMSIAGNAGVPAYAMTGNASTGMYLYSGNSVGFSSSGTAVGYLYNDAAHGGMLSLLGNGASKTAFIGTSTADGTIKIGATSNASSNSGGTVLLYTHAHAVYPDAIELKSGSTTIIRFPTTAPTLNGQLLKVNTDGTSSFGSVGHDELSNRDSATQHPIAALYGTAAYRIPFQNNTNSALSDNANLTFNPTTGLRVSKITTDTSGDPAAPTVVLGYGNGFYVKDGAKVSVSCGGVEALSFGQSGGYSDIVFKTDADTRVARVINTSNDSATFLSSSINELNGANIKLYGGAHATKANRIELYSGPTLIAQLPTTQATADGQVLLFNMDGTSSFGNISAGWENGTFSGSTISLDSSKQKRWVYTGGAVISVFIGGQAPFDAQSIRIFNSTNNVVSVLQSSTVLLNGNCTLGRGGLLELQYSVLLNSWVEVSRNSL